MTKSQNNDEREQRLARVADMLQDQIAGQAASLNSPSDLAGDVPIDDLAPDEQQRARRPDARNGLRGTGA